MAFNLGSSRHELRRVERLIALSPDDLNEAKDLLDPAPEVITKAPALALVLIDRGATLNRETTNEDQAFPELNDEHRKEVCHLRCALKLMY